MHTQLDAPLPYKKTLNVAADILNSDAFHAVIIQSMPGTGKNSMMPALQQMIGCKHRFMIKPGHHEVYEFQGLPVPDDKTRQTYFYPSGDLLPPSDQTGGTMVVLDEFSDSLTPIQNLQCQWILELGMHAYKFPENTKFVLLGNSITHRSGAQRVITKLSNRAGVIHFMPTVMELFNFGGKESWPASVLAFLKERGSDPINPNDKTKTADSEFIPTYFNSFDPNDPAQALKPVFASSRSWEAVAKLIAYIDENNRSMEDYELLLRCAALVGMPVASAYVPFRSEVSAGPNPDDIAEGKRVPYPKKTSILWNLTISLVQRATAKNVKVIYDWLVGTGNSEFSILFAIQCFNNKGKYLIGPAWSTIMSSPEFRQAMQYND